MVMKVLATSLWEGNYNSRSQEENESCLWSRIKNCHMKNLASLSTSCGCSFKEFKSVHSSCMIGSKLYYLLRFMIDRLRESYNNLPGELPVYSFHLVTGMMVWWRMESLHRHPAAQTRLWNLYLIKRFFVLSCRETRNRAVSGATFLEPSKLNKRIFMKIRGHLKKIVTN